MPSKLKPKPKPIRYRAGKAPAPEVASSSESDDESASDNANQALQQPQPLPSQQQQRTLPPKVTSFPRTQAPQPAPGEEINEEEFETEEEEDVEADGVEDGDSGSSSASGSGSEETSDSDSDSSTTSTRRKLLRPIFVKKADRKADARPTSTTATTTSKNDADDGGDHVDSDGRTRRKAEVNELIQEQLDRRAAAAAADQRAWDDDQDVAEEDMVDDTDGLDPDYELASWKLRELQRVKRERAAIEESERELAEVERRRNLSAAEREEEDRQYLEAQRQERDGQGQGQAGFMKKYHHRGAFFQDTEAAKELAGRDLMGASYVDEVRDRSVLPKFLQVRDETMVGRKGRQKHRDLRSEDTGRWGDLDRDGRNRGKGEWVGDERFRPDYAGRRDYGEVRTGANAGPLAERKRGGEGDDERQGKRSRVST